MLPLSFSEYASAVATDRDIDRLYNDYILNSGFPYTFELDDSRARRMYLQGIYDTIVLKDIITQRRFPDVDMLQSVVRYIADVGLRYTLRGTQATDVGHILENVVYLELIRRGYEVYIGKIGSSAVDFIAVGDQGEEYYQVAYTLTDADGATLRCELAYGAWLSPIRPCRSFAWLL
jgi:predicted AAA+ superfamily ATPase